jgi:NAD(P)H-hydrate repair Nnr-like enzyme with NAD(P)H-hydrate epimerase domain
MATGLDLDVGHDLQHQIKTDVTLTLTYTKKEEGKENQCDQYKEIVPTMMLVKNYVRRS